MNFTFTDAFVAHISGRADKAGISPLHLWIEINRENGRVSNAKIAEDLITIIKQNDMSKQGSWAALAYVVRTMKLSSVPLAEAIDYFFDNKKIKSTSNFDIYSGWNARIDLGGVLTPKMLNDRLSLLRSNAAPHWLDLAIRAYGADYSGLLEAVKQLASDGLISALDIEDRYRDISSVIGSHNSSQLLDELINNTDNLNLAQEVKQWANQSLGHKYTTSEPISGTKVNSKSVANPQIVDQIRNKNFRQPCFDELEMA